MLFMRVTLLCTVQVNQYVKNFFYESQRTYRLIYSKAIIFSGFSTFPFLKFGLERCSRGLLSQQQRHLELLAHLNTFSREAGQPKLPSLVCVCLSTHILMEREIAHACEIVCSHSSNFVSRTLCRHGKQVFFGVVFDACCSRNTWYEEYLLGFLGPLYQISDRKAQETGM